MLVLSRKEGETIVIIAPNGERITIGFKQIINGGQKCRVGIEAPPDYKIYRSELSPHMPTDEK